MDAHALHGPFTTLDASMYIERSILKRSRENNRPCPAKLTYTCDIRSDHSFSRWNRYLERANIDATSQPFLLYPHCQGFNGGIEIDEHASTSIAGLYAAGESAGGIHGANRMGGNSILATQVFGHIAGTQAAAFAAVAMCLYSSGQSSVLRREKTICPAEKLCENSKKQCNAMPFWSEMNRSCCLLSRKLVRWKAHLMPVPLPTWEKSPAPFLVANALTAARMIVTSMLARQETIGGHLRTDTSVSSRNGKVQPQYLNRIQGG